ncbi:MAG: acetyl-CoA C-acetyltransferase/enoyl-CoA hydratase/crotonobetainyl-CoA hydratase [Chloroflexi bacterium]|nr:MAG: acetyl-CoA C-acetyltransferase/enoyl-CoA hydratase/crotonobetainyl-CoA hydratase [Chloroflexota bacterium]
MSEPYDPAKHGRDTAQETFGPEVLVERRSEGRIHLITLNRPHRLNALGGGLREGLFQAWTDFRDDPTARVAVLTGAGRAFSAGADLIETADRRAAEDPANPPAPPSPEWRASMTLAEGMGVWKPVIGAINGPAVAGGFALAMQADIRVMSESAWVGIAEARWNMGGASWMIPITRQIGLPSALELILWGDTRYDAARCYALGWVQRVVPAEQLLPVAMEYAERMLQMAPRAVRNFKEALYRGYYMEPLVGRSYGDALEQNLAGMKDSLEGPRAFAEKRAPHFTDT